MYMVVKIRIITVNMCVECSDNKDVASDNSVRLLASMKGDVIIMQETDGYDLEKISLGLDMHILRNNCREHTCVMINPTVLIKLDSYHVCTLQRRDPIYIGGVHLTDIPSVIHHLNGLVYKSDTILPINIPMDRLIQLCRTNRLPRLRREISRASNCRLAIIAGDFNEPSHLDLPNIDVPCSAFMLKHEFVDTYKHIHPTGKGYTWPNNGLYRNEPNQRVDFIYTRNLDITHSYVSSKGSSDHKMVITEVILPK
jgi:endonuclease/exonuclease/phosphatase family metal-dependent hydrolase